MKTEPSIHRQYSGFSGVVRKVLDKARRIIRFMGLRSVKPFPPNTPSLMTHEPSAHYEGKSLADRNVAQHSPSDKKGGLAELSEKYAGFRANNTNLKSLLNDLTQTKTGQWPDESDEQFQYRLKNAMVLSGLGSLLQDETLAQRRRITPSIKSRQIQKLGEYMAMKPLNFYQSVVSNQPHIGETSGDVGAFLVTNLRNQPVNNNIEARNWYLFCRAYLDEVSDEVLGSVGYDMNQRKLSDCIPDLGIEKMDGNYIENLNETISSMDKVKPTSAETVKEYCKEHGIVYIPGQKTVAFDVGDKLHQSLFLLQYLRNTYESSKLAILSKFSGIKDSDQIQAFMPEKQLAGQLSDHMRGLTDTVAQNLMKKSMPDSYAVPPENASQQKKPFSYQQALLIADDNRCYWNSDDNQPRHGRQDEKPLESFEEYLERSEKEQA
ncbi:hypothetical protein [Endozoicomonas lisbonensis]|uniref:Uncharacterized protein n=1 Tax=Endozoicomonas lisbonensis TaxID=3120522 RepID=A0ABV2SLP8_9GAMM